LKTTASRVEERCRELRCGTVDSVGEARRTHSSRSSLPLESVKRFVDAHHVKHWSAGGETSLDNLLLLCSHHHQLVHEGGFRIERDYQHRWFFKRPATLSQFGLAYVAAMPKNSEYQRRRLNGRNPRRSFMTYLEKCSDPGFIRKRRRRRLDKNICKNNKDPDLSGLPAN